MEMEQLRQQLQTIIDKLTKEELKFTIEFLLRYFRKF